MRFNTVLYCLKQGVKNIFKNKLFSLASISTMAACIFLFGLFYAIVMNVQYMIDEAQESICVTVFFEEGTSETRIQVLGEQISLRPEVSRVEYTSADEAWESFKEIYFEGNEEYAKAFMGDNPLANHSSYAIYLTDATSQESLVEYLETIPDIRKINKSDLTANSFADFGALIGYISGAIILILLAVAVFLISNTVSVGITVRREEISIMKLIGATDFLVKAPFLVEGILIGIIGAALPLAAIYYLYEKVVTYILEKFSILNSIMVFLPIENVFRSLLPVGLVLGVGIGFLGSSMTTRKHLRV
ncbi:MAG: permease-like cell division protein FtsX [Lachnospiraceae bacterium]|nr:permease-like cell division protein FtsX [Lachnospiraceae bacterium]